MTALWIVLGVLGGLGLLCLLPVGILAVYDRTFSLWVTAAGLRFRLLPQKEKKKQKQRTSPAKAKAPAKKQASLPPAKTLLAYAKLAWELLGDLRRRLVLRELTLHAVFGGREEDAGLHYGEAWAAIGVVTPILENTFTIRKRDIAAEFEQDAASVRLYAEASAVLPLWQLLFLLIHALKKISNLKKGGANHEQSHS